jgi:hypothetical protein
MQMPLAQLLRSARKRADAINDLEEVFGEVFGHSPGAEPDIYADYDRCVELMQKMRQAINTLTVF